MAKPKQKIALSQSRDIPFNRLVLSQSNVRYVKARVSIEELAQDMHTRADGPAHVAASAEFELRRTRAQLKATTRMLLVSIAAGISAASAAIAAAIAVYLAFRGIR